MQKHVSDTRRARGSITNQFPDPKNPHLESKIIKIGLGTPEIWLTNTDSFFSGTLSQMISLWTAHTLSHSIKCPQAREKLAVDT